ncbi:MAG: cysteine-rich CWC family protein [Pseudomonadota bacterium]|nr:cysteine-rich CWC family protein [Pseudomonadota bacterium]
MSVTRTAHAAPVAQPCSQCGAAFVCGGTQGLAHCWCAELSPILPVPAATARCLCPTCLAAVIRERASAIANDASDASSTV